MALLCRVIDASQITLSDPARPARDATLTALDFETTGPVPGWPDEPWQMGLVTLRNGRIDAGSLFEAYLRVGERPFNPHAPGRYRQVRDTLAVAPALSDLWPALSPRLLEGPLIAHNAAVERGWLRKTAPLHRMGPWIDTLRLLRMAYPGWPSYTLEDALEALGLLPRVTALCPGRAPHDALFDAVGCAAIVEYLLEQPGWASVSVSRLVRARSSTRRSCSRSGPRSGCC